MYTVWCLYKIKYVHLLRHPSCHHNELFQALLTLWDMQYITVTYSSPLSSSHRVADSHRSVTESQWLTIPGPSKSPVWIHFIFWNNCLHLKPILNVQKVLDMAWSTLIWSIWQEHPLESPRSISPNTTSPCVLFHTTAVTLHHRTFLPMPMAWCNIDRL